MLTFKINDRTTKLLKMSYIIKKAWKPKFMCFGNLEPNHQLGVKVGRFYCTILHFDII